MADEPGPVTTLLRAWRAGDRGALDQLIPIIYGELHRLAAGFHYFGGLTQGEIADALDVHPNTVARDLRFAQAWLQRHLLATG